MVGAARHGIGIRPLALLAATATFLVLPYAFNYDLTVVSLAAVATMSRDMGPVDRRLAAVGFLSPQLGMLLAMFGLPVMPLMLAGLAIVQFRAAIRDISGPETSGTAPLPPYSRA